MDDRSISLNAAIDALDHLEYTPGEWATNGLTMCKDAIKALPSAQTELENKIRAIGYTGKEGRIYIGGRLFAVRELPQ